jgi:hypothetical protein
MGKVTHCALKDNFFRPPPWPLHGDTVLYEISVLFSGHVTCGEISSGSEFEFTNSEFPASVPNETQHCSLQV